MPNRIAALRASLRSGARDLFLIVTGVLLALGADSWREARQERRAELVVLSTMRSGLVADAATLRDGVARSERAVSANELLQAYLAAGHPYADSLDAYFGAIYVAGGAGTLNIAPYEALKGRGLQLITNDALRLQIIEVYENTYAAIRRQDEYNTGVMFDVLRPYYLAHFRNLRFGENATPIDFDVLRHDRYFLSILEYRADFIRRAMLDWYLQALRSIESLLMALDAELATGE